MRERQRPTFRNSKPYYDENFPELVFLVPKYIARQWRLTENLFPDSATLSVFIRRDRDSMLLLDIPHRTSLLLRPRLLRPSQQKEGGDDDEGESVACTVVNVVMLDRRGRRADVDVCIEPS